MQYLIGCCAQELFRDMASRPAAGPANPVEMT
jgi:hypothetical protein